MTNPAITNCLSKNSALWIWINVIIPTEQYLKTVAENKWCQIKLVPTWFHWMWSNKLSAFTQACFHCHQSQSFPIFIHVSKHITISKYTANEKKKQNENNTNIYCEFWTGSVWFQNRPYDRRPIDNLNFTITQRLFENCWSVDN